MKKIYLAFMATFICSSLLNAQTVFINEIHYDNSSSDVNEGVEIAGPAGTDLTGWSILLYNGNNGGVYHTESLTATLSDQSNGFGFLSVPIAGIQNGAPDGIALVDNSNNVIQFLSYEGTLTATDGAANGLTSTDLGVEESGGTTSTQSMQLTGTGTSYTDFSWSADIESTFGSVNTGQTFASASTPIIIINSSLSDFQTAEGSASSSQSFTVEGNNLTGDATVTAPTNFEVSLDDASFSTSVTLTQSGGDLSGEPVTVYVRVTSSSSTGSISGDIDVSSTGAANQTASLVGFVASSTAVTTPYDQTFNSEPSDWYVYSVASSATWSYNSSGYFIANAFGDDAPAEDWLISPKIDISSATKMAFSFDSRQQFSDDGEASPLKVYYSTNYSGFGDPSGANWTEVSSSATFGAATFDDAYTFSDFIDMSQEREDFYVAFVYTSSGTGGGSSSQIRIGEFSAGDLTTWSGSWDNGMPDMNKYAKISSAYNTGTDGNLVSRDLFVSGTLTIPSGSYATVHKEITNNGTVTVNSGGSLLIMEQASTSGTGSYAIEKSTPFSTTEGKYSVIGSPVTSADTDVLGSIVYSYDESVAYGTNGGNRFIAVTSAESMTVGDAYFSANTGDISFSGIPNAGTISKDIIYDESNDVSAANAGYNLVSNPYTAAIDVDAFITANSSTIGGSIYLWDDGGSLDGQRTNDDYIVYNSSAGATRTTAGGRENNFDKFLRSGQGFFVKATQAGSISFNPALMSTGNNSDGGFFRSEKENVIRLSISSGSFYSDILVSLVDDATTDIDPMFDAYKAVTSKGLQLYSIINNEAFAIQGLPTNIGEHTINLGFDAAVKGSYTIQLEEGAFANHSIYLYDRQLDKMVDMNQMKAYSFSSGIASASDRFQLVLSPSAILGFDNPANSLSVYAANNTLNIQTKDMSGISAIKVYSINGQLVNSYQVNVDSDLTSLPFSKKGLHIIMMESENNLMVQKFIAQ